jgi:hypothetical protein
MNFESETADQVLKSTMKNSHYIRANIPTLQKLDTYAKKDIDAMHD